MITRAELFAGTTATDLAARVLAPFREIPVDRAVGERAGQIRRENGLRLPDALIAATALEHNLGLATRNTKHFEPVRVFDFAHWAERLADHRAPLRSGHLKNPCAYQPARWGRSGQALG